MTAQSQSSSQSLVRSQSQTSSQPPHGLLDAYDASGFYCEMTDGALRDPGIAEVLARLSRVTPEDLRRRAEIAECIQAY